MLEGHPEDEGGSESVQPLLSFGDKNRGGGGRGVDGGEGGGGTRVLTQLQIKAQKTKIKFGLT